MTLPLVSILIPTFNQKLNYLDECIKSALSQDYANIEVVVSNNHSSNGAAELLSGYVDDRLRVVMPHAFVSMNENFSFCAAQAKGEFISFLSSDDVLLPTAISNLAQALIGRPNVVFGCGNIFYADRLPPSLDSVKYLIRPPGEGVRFLFGEEARSFFMPWRLAATWMAGDLIRRDAYGATGGFESCNLHAAGDVWITSRLLDIGGFAYIEMPLALFRSRAIGHVEVDPDRRIFDFLDQLILADAQVPRVSMPWVYRFRQWLVLAHRLGVHGDTVRASLLEAESVFKRYSRPDLLSLLNLYRRTPFLFRMTASVLQYPVNMRDFLKRKFE